jgi:formate-nitrite transporter family protein
LLKLSRSQRLQRSRDAERGVKTMAPRKSSAGRHSSTSSVPDERRGKSNISDKDHKDVKQRSSPSTPVIYEVVRRLGDEEMARPVTSLWWSGVAGGLSIAFSLLAQAILQTHLPDAPWRFLVSSLGYSAGFVMAVLSRQQLFTESTITAVLPVMNDLTVANCWRLSRMWAVVLASNMTGTFAAAAFFALTPVLMPELKSGMLDIAGHLIGPSLTETMFRAIAAGFLMAMMVWLLPSAEAAQFHVIVLITYLIAAAHFTHIVAGSAEAFFLILTGHLGVGPMLADFLLPVLFGNIIGGTLLFAMIAYAQVMNEI